MTVQEAIGILQELELACRAGAALLERGVIADDGGLGAPPYGPYDFAVGRFAVKKIDQSESEFNAANN